MSSAAPSMIPADPAIGRARASSLALGFLLVASMTIAAIAPFDRAFSAATAASPLLRPILIAVLALIGTACARANGMSLTGQNAASPFRIGLLAGAGVAAWVALIDGFVFRHLLTQSYVDVVHLPLQMRLGTFMIRAFNEGVIYRLFVFSSLVWLVRKLRRGAVMRPGMLLLIAVITQSINIGINVLATTEGPLTGALLAYDALRFIAPGVVWAWVFSRHGFFTAEVAAVSCHLFLQPTLSALI